MARLSRLQKLGAEEAGQPIRAALAGNIYQVLVRVGDFVEEGDVLLVVEAMKMETEIRADRDGKILAMEVKEGASIAVGEILAVIG